MSRFIGGDRGEYALQVNRLHPVFAAELIGAVLASPPDEALVHRCTPRCATPFDHLNHKRDLRRAPIGDPRLVQAPVTEQSAATA